MEQIHLAEGAADGGVLGGNTGVNVSTGSPLNDWVTCRLKGKFVP